MDRNSFQNLGGKMMQHICTYYIIHILYMYLYIYLYIYYTFTMSGTRGIMPRLCTLEREGVRFYRQTVSGLDLLRSPSCTCHDA